MNLQIIILALALGFSSTIHGASVETKSFATTLATVTRSSKLPAETGSVEAIFIENDGTFNPLDFGENDPIGFELLVDRNNNEGAPFAIIPIFNTTESTGKDGLNKREDFDVEAFLSRLPRFWRYAWRRPRSQRNYA